MNKKVLAGLAVGGAAAAAAVPRVREAAVDTYYRAQDAWFQFGAKARVAWYGHGLHRPDPFGTAEAMADPHRPANHRGRHRRASFWTGRS
jgi:hypothetical protein